MTSPSIGSPFGPIGLLDRADETRVHPGGPKGLRGRALPIVARRERLRELFRRADPDVPLPPVRPLGATFPAKFSWRSQGMVTPVRNQNPYGTCWAFATVGALEASWLRRHGEVVDVSEQDLINCNCRPCVGTPAPGWNGSGEKLLATGLEAETVLPYKGDGNVSPCSAAKVKANCGPCNATVIRPYRAEQYVVVDPNAEDLVPADVSTIKQAILDHGPIVVKMHIPQGSSIGSFKGKGTFKETVPLVYGDDPSTPQKEKDNHGAHIVVLTGWDDSKKAWEMKNSWGTDWGDGGYGWIAWGSNKIGMGAWWVRAWAPEFRVTAVWRKEAADERQVYGWSYENYRALYDRIWKEGYRLHVLDTVGVQGEREYSAVWRKGATSEVQVYGWSYEDFQAKYDELWPKGWRISLLSNDVIGSNVRYTAVWRKGTAAEMQWYGATYAGFKKKYDELWPQGWRIELLSNYVAQGTVRYNAVWRKGTAAEIQLFGAVYADYRKRYDELWPQGWRLHLLTNYVIGGKVRYNAVWRKSTKPEVQVYSWEYDDFREKDAELRAQGWRLALVNTYTIG